MRYIMVILLAAGIWNVSVAQEYVCTEKESGESRMSGDKSKPDELQYDEYDYNINDDQLDEQDRQYDYSSTGDNYNDAYQFESSESEDVDMNDEMLEDTSASCPSGSSMLNDTSSFEESASTAGGDTSLFMEEDYADNSDQTVKSEEELVTTSDEMTEATETVTYKKKEKGHQSKFRNIVEAPFKVATTIVSETGEGIARIAYSPVKGITKLFRGEPKDQYNKKYRESVVENPSQPVEKTEYYYEETEAKTPMDEGYDASSEYNFDSNDEVEIDRNGDVEINSESPYQDETDVEIHNY
ncbi:hypothetical protein [Sporocytophaga myxococcoides]|uniref:hypothetical protein n=1 Tax=Sporocytophaga myxococcoides TaxID=153721 RepID=UPI0003F7E0CB|nr:hypothetical protein [Sporocytophaga myxococcoides]